MVDLTVKLTTCPIESSERCLWILSTLEVLLSRCWSDKKDTEKRVNTRLLSLTVRNTIIPRLNISIVVMFPVSYSFVPRFSRVRGNCNQYGDYTRKNPR